MKTEIEQTFEIPIDELNLVEGCLKKNRSFQKSLYYKYCDAMFTIIYRMLNDYDEANDVLQEAFLQVFLKMDQFRRESSLGAWIKKIVVNVTLRHLKERKIFETFENNVQDTVNFIPDTIDGAILEKIILALPDGYRTIFLLVEVEGYKHREVAEMLNISEGTSKSQLYYAKKLLKEKLKNEYL